MTPHEQQRLTVWTKDIPLTSFFSNPHSYDSAFIGGTMALKSFTNEFGMLSETTSANVVSTYQAGAFFGSLCGYPLGHFFGRKWGLFLAAVVFCVGSGVMCSASQHTGLGPMYAGRALAGGAIGSASNLAPMYIAEIAPSSIRGQLVGLYELGWQIGGIIGFWINFSVDRNMVSSHRESASWSELRGQVI